MPPRFREDAKEGRYNEGKKYPNPCNRLETEYIQNSGLRKNVQFILGTLARSDGGRRPFKRGINGPVSKARATAMARNVVLYPYFAKSVCSTNGIMQPEKPEAPQRIP